MYDNIRRATQGHKLCFGPPRTGMTHASATPALTGSHYGYSVYWLFQAGRNLCIETELRGFTSVDDAGYTAQQYSPELFWSDNRLMLHLSQAHVPMVVQPGQYAVSRLADADRLHLYRHLRLTLLLPALHYRMRGQSFTFIRGFCGPTGEFYVR
jgi:hypothetical protein